MRGELSDCSDKLDAILAGFESASQFLTEEANLKEEEVVMIGHSRDLRQWFGGDTQLNSCKRTNTNAINNGNKWLGLKKRVGANGLLN
ncbi:hypothetical protein PIB30_007264 [Stylosanthes scabra]|uniref:Uncharacterized protein n=1 Tax=Stylosanthes scabra TaxID=79078 RepID=A0ABU6W2K2_9FABA|nr:hypothetical protein [Stylosanthes scabra]